MLRERARAWASEKLLALACILDPGESPEPRKANEDDEEEGLPPGHPIVVRSPEAERMIAEGAALAMLRQMKPEPKPVPPLAGSLRDRIERARNDR